MFERRPKRNAVSLFKVEDTNRLPTTPEGRQAAERFRSFQSKVLRTPIPIGLSRTDHLALVVIALEGLSDRSQLMSFLQALQQVEGDQYVTWVDSKGGRERRKLSAITLHLAKPLAGLDPSWADAVSRIEKHLSTSYPLHGQVAESSVINVVLQEGLALAMLHLAPALFAHIAGLQRLECLTERAWMRRCRFSSAADTPDTPGPIDYVAEVLLPKVFEWERPLSGAWFIERLVRVFSGEVELGSGRARHLRRERAVDRLQDLALELEKVGPIEALLLGWVVDMLRHGSYLKKAPSPRTLEIYARGVARLLHMELSRLPAHPTQLCAADWTQLYQRILDQSTAEILPALRSFHRYMVHAHDAEPASFGSSRVEDFHRPKVNLIWEHELARSSGVVARLSSDPRLTQQVIVWIELLRRAGIRFGELIRLRIRDIQLFHEGQWQIHVDHPSLKTESARRVISFQAEQQHEAVEGWFRRRIEEATTFDELLFGDPQGSNNVYRLGAAYSLLSRALKEATGDIDVVPHSLRHTFASFGFQKAVQGEFSAPAEVSQVEKLRVAMGHALVSTTLQTYCHLYEDSLRDGLDSMPRSVVRAVDVGGWLSSNAAEQRRIAAAVRQRLARGQSATALCELNRRSKPPAEPPVQSDIQPTPEFLSVSKVPSKSSANLLDLVKIALDFNRDLPIDKIALRAGLGESTVRFVIEGLGRLRPVRRRRPKRPDKGINRLTRGRWKRVCEAIQQDARESGSVDFRNLRGALCQYGLDAKHDATIQVLSLLRGGDFTHEHLVIRGCDPVALEDARWAVNDQFGALPKVERVCPRRGRPAVYIVPVTQAAPTNQLAASASSDVKTLTALLDLACLLAELNRQQGLAP
jgi:integrase